MYLSTLLWYIMAVGIVIVQHSIVISRKKKSDIMKFTLTSISTHTFWFQIMYKLQAHAYTKSNTNLNCYTTRTSNRVWKSVYKTIENQTKWEKIKRPRNFNRIECKNNFVGMGEVNIITEVKMYVRLAVNIRHPYSYLSSSSQKLSNPKMCFIFL